MVVEESGPALNHAGPRVELGPSGPARFVGTLYNGFRQERALEDVAFMDARYRTPGSVGFEETLDRIEAALRQAGFGTRPELELEILETALPGASWTARSAELRLMTEGGGEALLHSFEHGDDPDRCLLPAGAPAADVSGPVCLRLGDLVPGDVLVTEASLRPDLLGRAANKGAVAVISASLGSYNVDPSERERHMDAIQFRTVNSAGEMPVGQISTRSYHSIRDALEDGGARLALKAEVERGGRTTRTIVATIVGQGRADEVVALSSHLEAPGASDNASGAAGQLENALNLVRILDQGGLEHPARSLAFIWGLENEEATAWLEHQGRKTIAAVNAVMIGESRERTGAVPLLERYPDPGALVTLAPDEHTLWGSRDVQAEWLVPNGLSIIGRCALVDVSQHVGGWDTFENPYEGGTDHERFIASGVPAILFWHFTDFTFHTSLDRLEMVDGEELQRMATAAMASAMALADPLPGDLTRYLRCVDHERELRLAAAETAGEPDVAADWRAWSTGVRLWFRVHCLGLEGEEAVLSGPLESAVLGALED